VYGLGFVVGSLSGTSGGSLTKLKRRYVVGIAAMGTSGLLAGGFPVLVVCIPAFALAGLGNGQSLVHERLILQAQVAERLQGRLFALTEASVAIGIAAAYISAGVIAEAMSSRLAIVLTGVGELSVSIAAAVALRGTWTQSRRPPARPGGHDDQDSSEAPQPTILRGR
jgi:MFS family permease